MIVHIVMKQGYGHFAEVTVVKVFSKKKDAVSLCESKAKHPLSDEYYIVSKKVND